jgi:hypothetical protein
MKVKVSAKRVERVMALWREAADRHNAMKDATAALRVLLAENKANGGLTEGCRVGFEMAKATWRAARDDRAAVYVAAEKAQKRMERDLCVGPVVKFAE